MNPAIALTLEGSFARKTPATSSYKAPNQPTVLVATADPEIRKDLAELLRGFLVNAIWVNGVEEAKLRLRHEKIAACLCGFWLQDGTYRELIRHLRRERLELSLIIVSAPSCPNEYRDYLAAVNIGALDFLSHPYQPLDLERMLESAVVSHSRSAGSFSDRSQLGEQASENNLALRGQTA